MVITIGTFENTPEWRWFCSFVKRKGVTKSRQARESLRSMIEDREAGSTVEGLAKSLKARMIELEYRDREILELRHALGLHWPTPHPSCEACGVEMKGGEE